MVSEERRSLAGPYFLPFRAVVFMSVGLPLSSWLKDFLPKQTALEGSVSGITLERGPQTTIALVAWNHS